jgi:hypothetical protein
MAEPRNHITCQELVELATDYIERALSADDAELFEQHLNYCAGCERYVDEVLRTIEAGGRLRKEGVSSETLESLMETFRQRRRS